HVIADAHIYDKHIPIVEEIIKREPFTSPEFIIDKNIDDFYKFTIDSFVVKNYQFHTLNEKILVAE
ncbi:MAG: thymidylate synthase, partial [Clostridiales bacterium]|nr:thymidylate synthase [Clostridiales bacterium]